MGLTQTSGRTFMLGDILACGQGVLFGRGTPKIPAPPLLAFHRVDDIDAAGGKFERGYAVGSIGIADYSWAFQGHFIGDPVMPGVLLLDGLFQLSGFFAGFVGLKGKGRAVRAKDISFLRGVTPQDVSITYRIDVQRVLHQASTLITEGTVLVEGEIAVFAKELWLKFLPLDK